MDARAGGAIRLLPVTLPELSRPDALSSSEALPADSDAAGVGVTRRDELSGPPTTGAEGDEGDLAIDTTGPLLRNPPDCAGEVSRSAIGSSAVAGSWIAWILGMLGGTGPSIGPVSAPRRAATDGIPAAGGAVGMDGYSTTGGRTLLPAVPLCVDEVDGDLRTADSRCCNALRPPPLLPVMSPVSLAADRALGSDELVEGALPEFSLG
jgi:hypothetical protein